MKSLKKILPLCLGLLLVLTACGETKIETLTSTSPDGDKKVTINGSKSSPLAPIMVEMLFEVKNGKADFATEFASNSLTSENCTIVWTNNKDGYIEMVMPDAEKKIVDFVCTDDTVHVINRFYN